MVLWLLACGASDTGTPVVVPEPWSDCRMRDGDALQVLSATFEAPVLSAEVNYGGGCEDHDIVICWPSQGFVGSDPADTDLEPYHEAYDDGCEADITEVREFDLTPLQEAYTDQVAPSGSIIFRLGGVDEVFTWEL